MLVFGESAASDDILVLDLSTGSRTPLLDTDSNELAAVLSHDGTRLAYVSDKGGRSEVYVRPFPGPGSETPVSIGGGSAPIWSSDDSKLIYEGQLRSRLHAATIDGLRVVGQEVFLDRTRFWSEPSRSHSDVHPDGERLLVLKKSEDEGAPRINVVLDWFEELK